jgi:hypothetical protein
MSKVVQVPANFRGELLLPGWRVSLKANQTLTLSDDDFDSKNVQLAISKGFLVEKNAEKKAKKKTKSKPTIDTEAKVESEAEAEALSEPKTNMATWDAEDRSLLNKDDSARETMKQMKGTEMELQVGEIDFDKDKSTAKKNTKTTKKKTKTTKKAKKKKTTKKNKSSNRKKSLSKAAKGVKNIASSVKKESKSLKPVGKKRSPASTNMPLPHEEEEMSFVDQEQERERLAKHPVLSKRRNNEEVQ